MTEQDKVRTGGCQCGAVRFRIKGGLGRPSICHCRMCQKQFGGFFGPLVTAKGETEWTRDEPTYFQSSINIARGFCKQCGTPLAYKHPGGLEIAIGAFDDRSDLAPQSQVNYDARLPWVETIFAAPSMTTRTITASRKRSFPSSIPTTKPKTGLPTD